MKLRFSKIRMSLTAIAFVLGIGGALATNLESTMEECRSAPNPPDAIECPTGDNQLCCTVNGVPYTRL